MTLSATLAALGEVALALSPWLPTPRPRCVADVDASWLTSILAAHKPGARVLDVEDRGGSAGTTDRRRLALTWNDAGTSAGLPALRGTSNRKLLDSLRSLNPTAVIVVTAESVAQALELYEAGAD